MMMRSFVIPFRAKYFIKDFKIVFSFLQHRKRGGVRGQAYNSLRTIILLPYYQELKPFKDGRNEAVALENSGF